MFLEMVSEKRDVRVVEEYMDFGFTDHGRLSEGKQVTIENTFPFPVRASWALL
jgi:hypothetical protein